MNMKAKTSVIHFNDIPLNTDWQPGSGLQPSELPNTPGIYAEIHWPQKGVRVGETGISVRNKIRHDIRWFKAMHERTAPEAQLRRTLPIAEIAKAKGHSAFDFYLVSDDPRLSDKLLRQECERFLFAWLDKSDQYVNWNRQRSWR